MDVRLTEEQLQLAETVRDYLRDTHGPEVLRRLDAAGGARDPQIWRGLVEMGLTGLLVPEAQGGLGLGLVEGALVAIEAGRACLAEPLVETALIGVPALVRQGNLHEFQVGTLQQVVAGDAEFPNCDAINPWAVDFTGPVAQSVDPLRRLSFLDHGDSDPDLVNIGAVMSAAQLVGLAEAMLEQATEYAKVRTQFGQPIGGFQAIKHQLASCAVAIEFARPVVLRAAAAMQARTDSAPVHVSHAKVAATDAAWTTAETAIQVHGAMGYTYEVDLHFWMKRSWALGGAWGDRAFHIARVDDAVLGGTLPVGPEHTFA